MNEQKYVVKLKSQNKHNPIYWCGDKSEWQPYYDNIVFSDELDDSGDKIVLGYKISEYIPSYTKPEVSEIMDGTLYKSKQYENDWIDTCECSSCEFTREKYGEWINPLIELVPVESEVE